MLPFGFGFVFVVERGVPRALDLLPFRAAGLDAVVARVMALVRVAAMFTATPFVGDLGSANECLESSWKNLGGVGGLRPKE
jgi:hypothetical protein